MASVVHRCDSCGRAGALAELGDLCAVCARKYGLLGCECPHTSRWYCGCQAGCPVRPYCNGVPLPQPRRQTARPRPVQAERSEP